MHAHKQRLGQRCCHAVQRLWNRPNLALHGMNINRPFLRVETQNPGNMEPLGSGSGPSNRESRGRRAGRTAVQRRFRRERRGHPHPNTIRGAMAAARTTPICRARSKSNGKTDCSDRAFDRWHRFQGLPDLQRQDGGLPTGTGRLRRRLEGQSKGEKIPCPGRCSRRSEPAAFSMSCTLAHCVLQSICSTPC